MGVRVPAEFCLAPQQLPCVPGRVSHESLLFLAGHSPDKRPDEEATRPQHSAGAGSKKQKGKDHAPTCLRTSCAPGPTLLKREILQCPRCSTNGACAQVTEHITQLVNSSRLDPDERSWIKAAKENVLQVYTALVGQETFGKFLAQCDVEWRSHQTGTAGWDDAINETPPATLDAALPNGRLIFCLLWWHRAHGKFFL